MSRRTSASSRTRPTRCRYRPAHLNPEPTTLNPPTSTLHPQPPTLNPQPSALNPSTLNYQPSTLNPTPSTLTPAPQTAAGNRVRQHRALLGHRVRPFSKPDKGLQDEEEGGGSNISPTKEEVGQRPSFQGPGRFAGVCWEEGGDNKRSAAPPSAGASGPSLNPGFRV